MGKLEEKLVEQSEEDNNEQTLTYDDIKAMLDADDFSVSSTWKLIKHLGYKRERRRKCYYNDKHENENRTVFNYFV